MQVYVFDHFFFEDVNRAARLLCIEVSCLGSKVAGAMMPRDTNHLHNGCNTSLVEDRALKTTAIIVSLYEYGGAIKLQHCR